MQLTADKILYICRGGNKDNFLVEEEMKANGYTRVLGYNDKNFTWENARMSEILQSPDQSGDSTPEWSKSPEIAETPEPVLAPLTPELGPIYIILSYGQTTLLNHLKF
jgi:hypothetical protein